MPRRLRWPAAVLTLAAACHDGGPTPPDGGIAIGESFVVSGAQSVQLDPGSNGGTYAAVLVNNGTTPGVYESYSLRGTGLEQSGVIAARLPAPTAERDRSADPTLAPDYAFENRLRERERAQLTPRMAVARATLAMRSSGAGTSLSPSPRRSGLPAAVKVGDMVTVNVNGEENCTNPIYHRARVAAIGTHSIVLADSLNPAGGFTDADYARYATRFDTLVYPLDVGAFGEPTDIDGNGRIGLIFTLEVNRLTPSGSPVYVGGFTFSRDLFPVQATDRAQACPTSNEGEFFYLMAPDPQGRVNGNRRTAGFVDTNTTAIIAHEFEHLINSSRRLYVNNTDEFEVKWLDEGLAHIAEELLFYHEAGMAPRANVDAPDIQASQRRATAFNLDMTGGGNTARYRGYLFNTARSSPYAADDSINTRGAVWNLLRYLADHAAAADGDIFYRLANGPATGIENLQAVFGRDLPTRVRDWATSHAVDDVAMTSPTLQQPSWNWHSIYATLTGAYPLQLTQLVEGSTYSGNVVAGGAAYYRFSVPGGGKATLAFGGQAGSTSKLQLVVVRIQ